MYIFRVIGNPVRVCYIGLNENKSTTYRKGRTMQIRIDVKSVLLGIILGGVVFLVMGQALSGAGKADFGISVSSQGRAMAIVRSYDGTLYAVDPDKSRPEVIEHSDGPFRGRAFNLNRTTPQEDRK